MKKNHINYTDAAGRVYCYRLNEIVELDAAFYDNNCRSCPYFNGSAQGDGVECLYSNGSNEKWAEFYDAVQAEEEAQRLREEVVGKK